MVQPVALRLQASTGCYCTEYQEIKPSMRENDTTKRLGKHSLHQAAAVITQNIVLQQTFLEVEIIRSKIIVNV